MRGIANVEIYIFFILLIISLGSFLYEIHKRYRFVRLGRPENRCGRPWERWKGVFTHVLGQKRVLDHPLLGVLHGFILWGFLILLVNIPNMVAQGLFHTGIPYVVDNPVYIFIKDLFDVLIIIAVTGNLWRRLVRKPRSLDSKPVSLVILLLILVIAVSEVLFHASWLVMVRGASGAGAAPLALALSGLLAGLPGGILPAAGKIFWWAYFLAIFALLFIVPRSKHLHLVCAPFNTYWRSLAPMGALQPTGDGEKEQARGAARLENFTWKQLLDAYACVKCGRCNDACPAFQSGEPVKPKQLSGRLRKHIETRGPLLLQERNSGAGRKVKAALAPPKAAGGKKAQKNKSAGLFDEETIWNCTTCGSCQEACPVSVEHVGKIVAARRWAVSTGGNVPAGMQRALAAIEGSGYPWGHSGPAAWRDGFKVWSAAAPAEYLYYPGCAGLSDARAALAARSLARILQTADVDFAVWGAGEWCCGGMARRIGDEGLFAQTVQKNITRWNGAGVRKIVTNCPHCFNTLKNEYPQFGGKYEVVHHSVLLAELLAAGALQPKKELDKTVTYHDPCYLGRYNNIYDEPRKILQGVPGLRLTGMPRSGKRSWCCGAGGGRIWTGEESGNLMGRKLAGQAQATGAAVVATACPYCLMVLERERQGYGETMDVAEILGLCL